MNNELANTSLLQRRVLPAIRVRLTIRNKSSITDKFNFVERAETKSRNALDKAQSVCKHKYSTDASTRRNIPIRNKALLDMLFKRGTVIKGRAKCESSYDSQHTYDHNIIGRRYGRDYFEELHFDTTSSTATPNKSFSYHRDKSPLFNANTVQARKLKNYKRSPVIKKTLTKLNGWDPWNETVLFSNNILAME